MAGHVGRLSRGQEYGRSGDLLEGAAAAGRRNVMVSNHIPELTDLVQGLNLTRHFAAIVSSGVVGYEKPHRQLFEAALPHGRPGETVWMIGDNPDADCRPVCAMVSIMKQAIPR